MRPSTLHTTTACANSDISAARRFFSSSTEALARAIWESTSSISASRCWARSLAACASCCTSGGPSSVTRKLRLAPSIRRSVSAMRSKPSTYCLNSLCRTSTPITKPKSVIIVPTGSRDISNSVSMVRSASFMSSQTRSEVTTNGPVINRPSTTTARMKRCLAFMARIPTIFRLGFRPVQAANRRDLRSGNPEHGLDHGDQLLGGKGLGHVSIGPDRQSFSNLGISPFGRQHDNFQPRPGGIGTQGFADFEAGFLGHHHIEQNEFGIELGHLGQCLFTIDRDGYREALFFHQELKPDDDVRLVINDKDFFGQVFVSLVIPPLPLAAP